jgi:hypothetical protein
VLNNSRLKSPINQESFDVDVKHKFDNAQWKTPHSSSTKPKTAKSK